MDTVTEHLAHLARLNRRPGSIYQRQRALLRLRAFIAPADVLDASIDQLRAFTERDTHGSAAQAAEVTHLRMFYRWAVREELLAADPTTRLERPAVPDGLPRPMPAQHVRHALAHAPRRLYPWFHLAAYTGMRACEVGPLRGEDLREPGWIFIREQKGGAAGRVRIPPPLAPLVATWPRSGWLFPRLAGGWHANEREPLNGPTSAGQVSGLSNRWLHQHGIPDTFHSFRHWFGTELLRITGNLELVRKAMRHRSIQSTVVYTKVVTDEIAHAVDQLPDLTVLADEHPEAA